MITPTSKEAASKLKNVLMGCNLLSYFLHGNMNKRSSIRNSQKLSFGVCGKDSTLCVSSFISFTGTMSARACN